MQRINVNIGQRFTRLVIIREVDKFKGKRYFECKCDCGNIKIYRFVALRAGEIKSCGCLRNEQNRIASLTHGLTTSSLYSSWHCMKQRCLNPKNKNFNHYGGRGIRVCEEWLNFENFRDWALENGYKDGLTIERDKVNGIYEPSNCSWITKSLQNKNKRNNVILELGDIKMCLKDWAIKLGITNSAMQKRVKNWPLAKALTEPINPRYAA